jgi:hypothetical protein
VGARQREEKSAGAEQKACGAEKKAGRMVRADGHHLELYSEYWTALPVDGEGRSLGWTIRRFGRLGGSAERGGEADFSTSLRFGRNDGIDSWVCDYVA